MQSLYLVYLDRPHLGDDLFLKSLAQHLSEAGAEAPTCLLVHGSGEKVERTLEAQGQFPDRTNGVLEVENEEQRRLVERAVRETNQEIVATLTDEVVATVGIQGVDRGLLQKASDGTLRAPNVGWVSALLKQHVVPVVSALVEAPDTGAVREVWTAEAVGALAQALGDSFDPVACLLATTDRPGVPDDTDTLREEVAVQDLTEAHVSDFSAARRLLQDEVPLMVTNLQGLFGGAGVEGTQVRA